MTTTNSPYSVLTQKMLSSLYTQHPDIDVCCVCVRCDKDDIDSLRASHPHVELFIDDKIKDTDNERAYCSAIRCTYIKDEMLKRCKSILYMDCDIEFRRSGQQLFDTFKDSDVSVYLRSKNPIKTNAGIFFLRNNEKIMTMIDEYRSIIMSQPFGWWIDQDALNNVLESRKKILKISEIPRNLIFQEDSPVYHWKGLEKIDEIEKSCRSKGYSYIKDIAKDKLI